MKKSTITTLLQFFFAIISIIIFAACLLLGGMYYSYIDLNNKVYSESKFNKADWLKGSNSWESVRCGMFDDLSQNHLRIGMSTKEINDLLGKYNGILSYSKNNRDFCFAYKLGSCAVPAGATKKLLICIKNGPVVDFFRSDANDDSKVIGKYEPTVTN